MDFAEFCQGWNKVFFVETGNGDGNAAAEAAAEADAGDDDAEMGGAASTVQKHYRGHQARKEQAFREKLRGEKEDFESGKSSEGGCYLCLCAGVRRPGSSLTFRFLHAGPSEPVAEHAQEEDAYTQEYRELGEDEQRQMLLDQQQTHECAQEMTSVYAVL